jgi:hypothetical protein
VWLGYGLVGRAGLGAKNGAEPPRFGSRHLRELSNDSLPTSVRSLRWLAGFLGLFEAGLWTGPGVQVASVGQLLAQLVDARGAGEGSDQPPRAAMAAGLRNPTPTAWPSALVLKPDEPCRQF